MKFSEDKISDAKRLVRGEHWRYARGLLRRRDRTHHKSWRVLTLAGENPQEEIRCVRSLMPRAQIVAVDKSPTAVDAAIYAGADASIECDIGDFPPRKRNKPQPLPHAVADLGPFDVINLDLCCSPDTASDMIRKWSMAAAACRSVFMLTFSYGRDIAELYESGDFGPVPDPLAGRVRWLAEKVVSANMRIESVLAYAGASMPMCSCVWRYGRGLRKNVVYPDGQKTAHPPSSFRRVGNDDLYAAAVMFDRVDPAMLYALPADRIKHFKRKLAAEKAVATRRSRCTQPQ